MSSLYGSLTIGVIAESVPRRTSRVHCSVGVHVRRCDEAGEHAAGSEIVHVSHGGSASWDCGVERLGRLHEPDFMRCESGCGANLVEAARLVGVAL